VYGSEYKKCTTFTYIVYIYIDNGNTKVVPVRGVEELFYPIIGRQINATSYNNIYPAIGLFFVIINGLK
jgi:hypothetical protein